MVELFALKKKKKKKNMVELIKLTCMISGHIKDKSPTSPPLTVASAMPNEATIVHKPI